MLYRNLAQYGQKPQAMMISCADSRVMPETITQSGPGELFVCRNAGNIVPMFSDINGGVSSAIEYAILALSVRDIIICGHSDCGAMKGLCCPHLLEPMPNVTSWLRHSHAAHSVVTATCPGDMPEAELVRAVAMENVLMQLDHLRTHPSVAAKLATGELSLHGWFFDIETGTVLVYDGAAQSFCEPQEGQPIPVAVSGRPQTRFHDIIAAE
ncbi:MAG: carbonic anhydrase [Paracoccus sp. (in: a-proteobacteria)]